MLFLVAPRSIEVRIEVGYGLEGTLTDAISKLIIVNAIAPRFKAGDFDGGVTRGVDDIITTLTTDSSEWQKKPDLRAGRFAGWAGVAFLFSSSSSSFVQPRAAAAGSLRRLVLGHGLGPGRGGGGGGGGILRRRRIFGRRRLLGRRRRFGGLVMALVAAKTAKAIEAAFEAAQARTARAADGRRRGGLVGLCRWRRSRRALLVALAAPWPLLLFTAIRPSAFSPFNSRSRSSRLRCSRSRRRASR